MTTKDGEKKAQKAQKAKVSSEGYVHGYSSIEQERLKYQARFTEQSIYGSLDLSDISSLLEVGVGVGAQSEILLRRFPNIKITGIDQSTTQLNAARDYLVAKGVAGTRISTISYGKDRPVALGSSEDAWSQNRNAITSVR